MTHLQSIVHYSIILFPWWKKRRSSHSGKGRDDFTTFVSFWRKRNTIFLLKEWNEVVLVLQWTKVTCFFFFFEKKKRIQFLILQKCNNLTFPSFKERNKAILEMIVSASSFEFGNWFTTFYSFKFEIWILGAEIGVAYKFWWDILTQLPKKFLIQSVFMGQVNYPILRVKFGFWSPKLGQCGN